MDIPIFDVLMDNAPAPVRVTIRPIDQIRAEREGKQRGLSLKADPIHFSALWCWAAMTREGVYSGEFRQWLDECLAFDGVDEAKAGDGIVVDDEDDDGFPTQRGESTPPL